MLRATTACTFSTSQLPKVVWEWYALYILTWNCASRNNGAHFFDISTSKSGLRMVCVVHFDLKMWFAPPRVCTFSSTSQLLKVLRSWGVLCMFASICASRHNGGVHFFDISTSKSGPNVRCFWLFCFQMCFAPQRRALISHLASWLRTRRFSEPTFRPSRATNHWKNTVNRDFPTFSCTYILSLLTFSISYLLTSWLLLSDSSHLCFSICPYCRKFDF